MPREQINYPVEREVVSGSNVDGVPDRVTTYTDPIINVHWQGGHQDEPAWVSLSMQVELDEAREWAACAEQAPSLCSGALTRGEINKLIRVLRRARDSAYGRDE